MNVLGAATIPGLPPDLAEVPGYRRDGNGLEDPAWRPAWFAWREDLLRYRRVVRLRCDAANGAAQRAIERGKCAQSAAYFVAVWGEIYEPEGDGWQPWAPYAFQVELIDGHRASLEASGPEGDVVWSKCRRLGASWTLCALALHDWLFVEPCQIRLVSRREDLVDHPTNPDSLFWKIRGMLAALPVWLRPEGYDPAQHSMRLSLLNPANGNVVAGESTTSKSTRGGRATWIGFDEAAFIPGLLGVWSTAASTSRHRLAVSSESLEEGEDFDKLKRDLQLVAPQCVVELDWWLHPEQDTYWYEATRARFGPDADAFAREIERNPRAGFGHWIYEIARDYDVGDYPYEPGQRVVCGIDPGRDDLCALVWLAYDPVTDRYRAVDAYAARMQTPEYFASLMTGVVAGGADGWAYQPHNGLDPLDVLEACRHYRDVSYYGDPAGKNRTTGPSDSWYDRMARWSLEHTEGRHVIAVQVGWKMDQRTYQGRRTALLRLLPRIDFNDTPGVRCLLAALQNYRWTGLDKPRASELVKPLHNDDSHWVAALEYLAVNLDEMAWMTRTPLAPWKRRKAAV